MVAKASEDNLWIAAGDGQLERLQELVESGVDINGHDESGYTAMHAAVSYNQIKVVEFLIKNGAKVDIEDFEKDTPLYVAETVEMAQLLIDHGANPAHRNEEGISPAVTALEEGWTEVAEFLAGITKETLPVQEEEEEEDLSHVQRERDEDVNLDPEVEDKLQEIIRRIEAQGGVEDEEELREMVTKMILEELQNKAGLEQ